MPFREAMQGYERILFRNEHLSYLLCRNKFGLDGFGSLCDDTVDLRLLLRLERIGRLHLHPVGQFKGLNARFELRVLVPAAGMFLVQLMQQIQLLPLLDARSLLAAFGFALLAGATWAPLTSCQFALVSAASPHGAITEGFTWNTAAFGS